MDWPARTDGETYRKTFRLEALLDRWALVRESGVYLPILVAARHLFPRDRSGRRWAYRRLLRLWRRSGIVHDGRRYVLLARLQLVLFRAIYRERPLAEPTQARPATTDKVDVLALRWAAGLCLWNDADAELPDEEGIQASTLIAGKEARSDGPLVKLTAA